jgi:2-(1,2-epoxy-1,2-dihydrophenyl)acetyl-CoA isomerase
MSVAQTTTGSFVITERTGAVVTLRLNRPERLNALNPDLCRQLLQGLLRASDDKTVRAVMITGAGRGFCGGGDVDFLRDARARRSVRDLEVLLKLGKEICVAIATMPKAVVAAVNGPAAGGGMSLALACDLRVGSESAVLTQGFSRLGLYPDFGATFFLPRLVGHSRASELFYTTEKLSAAEARRVGILYDVYPQDKFEESTRELMENLASMPPLVFRDMKRTMTGEAQHLLETAIDEETRLQIHCFLTDDCAEGLAAFFEKRPPKFRGH